MGPRLKNSLSEKEFSKFYHPVATIKNNVLRFKKPVIRKIVNSNLVSIN
jgi:hypothetical protein